jgi:hypothetical protein
MHLFLLAKSLGAPQYTVLPFFQDPALLLQVRKSPSFRLQFSDGSHPKVDVFLKPGSPYTLC